MGRRGLVRQTKDVEHLRQTLHEFFEAGCDHWVADGGDGTLHWLLSVGWQVATERQRSCDLGALELVSFAAVDLQAGDAPPPPPADDGEGGDPGDGGGAGGSEDADDGRLRGDALDERLAGLGGQLAIGNGPAMAVARPDGGALQVLADGQETAAQPTWSPDGASLAWSSTSPERGTRRRPTATRTIIGWVVT